MVDMKATNLKLEERAKRIVMESTGCDSDTATKNLVETGFSIKETIVMILTGVAWQEAKKRLADNKGFIRKCI